MNNSELNNFFATEVILALIKLLYRLVKLVEIA